MLFTPISLNQRQINLSEVIQRIRLELMILIYLYKVSQFTRHVATSIIESIFVRAPQKKKL